MDAFGCRPISALSRVHYTALVDDKPEKRQEDTARSDKNKLRPCQQRYLRIRPSAWSWKPSYAASIVSMRKDAIFAEHAESHVPSGIAVEPLVPAKPSKKVLSGVRRYLSVGSHRQSGSIKIHIPAVSGPNELGVQHSNTVNTEARSEGHLGTPECPKQEPTPTYPTNLPSPPRPPHESSTKLLNKLGRLPPPIPPRPQPHPRFTSAKPPPIFPPYRSDEQRPCHPLHGPRRQQQALQQQHEPAATDPASTQQRTQEFETNTNELRCTSPLLLEVYDEIDRLAASIASGSFGCADEEGGSFDEEAYYPGDCDEDGAGDGQFEGRQCEHCPA